MSLGLHHSEVPSPTNTSLPGWRYGLRTATTSTALVGAMCPSISNITTTIKTTPLPWRRTVGGSGDVGGSSTKAVPSSLPPTASLVSRAAVEERLRGCLTPHSPSSLWGGQNGGSSSMVMDPCPCVRGSACEMCHSVVELHTQSHQYKRMACPSLSSDSGGNITNITAINCPHGGSSRCPFFHSQEERDVWTWVGRCAAAVASTSPPTETTLPPPTTSRQHNGLETGAVLLLPSLLLSGTTADGIDGNDDCRPAIPDVMFSTPDGSPPSHVTVRDVMCAVRDTVMEAEMGILQAVGLVVESAENEGVVDNGASTPTQRSVTSTTSVSVNHRSYDELLARLEALRQYLMHQSRGGRTLTATTIASYLHYTYTAPLQQQPPSEAMVEAVMQASHLFCPPSSRRTLLTAMLRYIGVIVDDDLARSILLLPTIIVGEGSSSSEAVGCCCLPELDVPNHNNNSFLGRLMMLIDAISTDALAKEALLQCWGEAVRGSGASTPSPSVAHISLLGGNGMSPTFSQTVNTAKATTQPPPSQQQLVDVAEWLWRALVHQLSISPSPPDAASALLSTIMNVVEEKDAYGDPSTSSSIPSSSLYPLMALHTSGTTTLVGAVSAALSSCVAGAVDVNHPLDWIRITDSAMLAVSQGMDVAETQVVPRAQYEALQRGCDLLIEQRNAEVAAKRDLAFIFCAEAAAQPQHPQPQHPQPQHPQPQHPQPQHPQPQDPQPQHPQPPTLLFRVLIKTPLILVLVTTMFVCSHVLTSLGEWFALSTTIPVPPSTLTTTSTTASLLEAKATMKAATVPADDGTTTSVASTSPMTPMEERKLALKKIGKDIEEGVKDGAINLLGREVDKFLNKKKRNRKKKNNM